MCRPRRCHCDCQSRRPVCPAGPGRLQGGNTTAARPPIHARRVAAAEGVDACTRSGGVGRRQHMRHRLLGGQASFAASRRGDCGPPPPTLIPKFGSASSGRVPGASDRGDAPPAAGRFSIRTSDLDQQIGPATTLCASADPSVLRTRPWPVGRTRHSIGSGELLPAKCVKIGVGER